MKNYFVKIVDSIPVPTPELGDKLVDLTLAFTAGFIIAMLVFGG